MTSDYQQLSAKGIYLELKSTPSAIMGMRDHLPEGVDYEQLPGMGNTLQSGETNEEILQKHRGELKGPTKTLPRFDNEENAPDANEETPPPWKATHHADEQAIRNLCQSMTQPGDEVDEALLKDDHTEQEIHDLMRTKAYLSASDPRYAKVHDQVKDWHDFHWGREPVKLDAVGRTLDLKKPKIAFPHTPDQAVEYPTGQPLDNAVKKVAAAVEDRARKSSPAVAVKSFQSLLNNQGDRQVRPLPMLKEDGIVGPKTRRALRFATQQAGADHLISGFRRVFS